MTTRKLTATEVEEVQFSDRGVPRRGVAIRPDHKGRPILHEDGKPLGLVVMECDCADWTDLKRKVSWIEIDYTGVPA